ncbi:MAG: SOS response-associated peptidase [Bacteroidia bacterium]
MIYLIFAIEIMCYTATSGTAVALKYAKHRGDEPEIIDALEKELKRLQESERDFEKLFNVSGFQHPKLLCFLNTEPYSPKLLNWGLIPHWVPDKEAAVKLSNMTLNARSETMLEKPAFRKSARSKRCLIYLDAFYEYHHFKSKTYPFHIAMKDGSPMSVAGLWDEYLDKETGELIQTCSIVTCEANRIMEIIHNNPKNESARMPVILCKENQDKWLETDDPLKLTKPYPEELLTYHTVRRLNGKDAVGNVPESELEFEYVELKDLELGG